MLSPSLGSMFFCLKRFPQTFNRTCLPQFNQRQFLSNDLFLPVPPAVTKAGLIACQERCAASLTFCQGNKLKLPCENGTEAPPHISWQVKKGHSNHQDIISEIQTTIKGFESLAPTTAEEVKLFQDQVLTLYYPCTGAPRKNNDNETVTQLFTSAWPFPALDTPTPINQKPERDIVSQQVRQEQKSGNNSLRNLSGDKGCQYM